MFRKITGFLGVLTFGCAILNTASAELASKKSVKMYAKYLKGSGSNQAKHVGIQLDHELEFHYLDPKQKSGELSQFTFDSVTQKFKVQSVDCRSVTKQMVNALIGHEVSVRERDSGDKERRMFLRRSDKLQSLLIAKNLNKVMIHERTKAEESGKKPTYKCTETTDKNGVKRACGVLDISYKPVKRKNKTMKGKAAILFAPEEYINQADVEISKSDIKYLQLMARVNGCGLRYVMKGLAQTFSDENKVGLVDTLESAMYNDIQELEKAGPLQSKDSLKEQEVVAEWRVPASVSMKKKK